jgi:hypothetical protein
MGQVKKKGADSMPGAVLDCEKKEYIKRQNEVLSKMNSKTYSKNKDNAMNNLVQAGIITEKGNLKKVYKG